MVAGQIWDLASRILLQGLDRGCAAFGRGSIVLSRLSFGGAGGALPLLEWVVVVGGGG